MAAGQNFLARGRVISLCFCNQGMVRTVRVRVGVRVEVRVRVKVRKFVKFVKGPSPSTDLS